MGMPVEIQDLAVSIVESLNELARSLHSACNYGSSALCTRAAEEIERLEARVSELESNPQVGTCRICARAIWRNEARMEDAPGSGFYHPICAMAQRIKALEQGKSVGEWIMQDGWTEIKGRECLISLEPRPTYCDRGNWIAKIEATGQLARDMDSSDLWPRYYMDLDRAKLEIEAWLRKRGQWPIMA